MVTFVIRRDGAGNPIEGAWRAPKSSVDIPLPSCTYVYDYTSVDSTRIISFHNASNSQGHWEYGQTADSDIEIGIQYGGAGTWTVSGTVHLANSEGSKVGGTTHNNYDSYTRTNFNYQHMHYTNGACPHSNNTHRVYAMAWFAGVADDGKYPGHSCAADPNRAYYPRGTSYTRNSSRAAKIGFAVGIGPVRLGQTSGHSVWVDMEWNDIRNNGIYLCGSDGRPATTAGVIYASNH